MDEVFLGHRGPEGHPERPERLVSVARALRAAGLEREQRVPVRAATDAEIGLVHAPGYFDDIRTIDGKRGYLDEDTFFSPESFGAARAAAGAAIDLVLGAIRGEHPRGLAVIRPPGHHALADRAMGFCLFNNAAIAAAAARAGGCARVAIVDWDAHHGNGTQAIFWRDPTVLYASTHQFPFYPGTGAANETGDGEGAGATVNVPMPEGAGDEQFARAFDQVIIPALRRFRPELIVVSAGYDAWDGDPLAGLRLSTAGYRALAERVVAAADELAGGRVVCLLEGGYDLDGLAACVAGTYQVLRGED
jgi:acetoin utilization deacetylase AcuC-like enzyme